MVPSAPLPGRHPNLPFIISTQHSFYLVSILTPNSAADCSVTGGGGGEDASLKRPIFHSQEVHLLVGLSGKMLHVVRLNYCTRPRGEDRESEVAKVRLGKTDQCDKSAAIR